jgi:magnesium transporter
MNPNFSLQDYLKHFKELLDKFEVEKHLIIARGGARAELEQQLLERQQQAELERFISRLHVADLADLLEILPTDERQLIWQHVAHKKRGDIMLELTDAVLENVLESMSHAETLDALRDLDAEELTFLSDELPGETFQAILAELSHEDRHVVEDSIQYECCQAGHVMTRDMIMVHEFDTLSSVQAKLRDKAEFADQTDKLYVNDARGHLVGALFLPDILLHDGDTLVKQIMREKVVTFYAAEDLDDVAQAFERYDLVSAPVINDRHRVIGRLTVDTVLDHIRETSQMDALNVVGVVEGEDLFANIWDSARNRWLWLTINLITAFFISRVIGMFEGTISQLVALASLMPIIASVAGNTGNQTTALVIRSLALNQLEGNNFWHLLRKELTISVLNGLVWGAIVGAFAFVFYQSPGLSVVVAVAMMMSFVLAAGLGVGAPVALERMGRDPAMGSSVILTGMIDALGFFVFLLLASMFLV